MVALGNHDVNLSVAVVDTLLPFRLQIKHAVFQGTVIAALVSFPRGQEEVDVTDHVVWRIDLARIHPVTYCGVAAFAHTVVVFKITDGPAHNEGQLVVRGAPRLLVLVLLVQGEGLRCSGLLYRLCCRAQGQVAFLPVVIRGRFMWGVLRTHGISHPLMVPQHMLRIVWNEEYLRR